MRAAMLAVLGLVGCPSVVPPDDPPPPPAEATWTQVEDRGARWTAWDGGDLYFDGALRSLGGEPPTAPPIEGEITWLGTVDGGVYAQVHGTGLLRWTTQWDLVDLPDLPLPGLVNPRSKPTPFGIDQEGDTVWLATVGGLLRSEDGHNFDAVPVGASGSLNVLFTDVLAEGDDVWAVAQLADSMLPSSFSGLLSGTFFHSGDGGDTWEELGMGLPAGAPMALHRRASGAVCVASLDTGVHCFEGGGWTAMTDPLDAVDLSEIDGRLVVGLSGGGLMIETADGWHTTASAPVLRVEGDRAWTVDGTGYRVNADFVPSAEPAGGTVHVALSFHVNLYHSYRGDTNDEDGYGKDLRIMRTTLDWLDERPQVHGDWDIENHFSLDGWMRTDGADVLDRIQQRVADGTDDVRLMSWNNGAMAAANRLEFDHSVSRGLESLEAAFDRVTSGVQPQENMISPQHLAWYREQGIDWVTLFYAANGFTGPREDIDLQGAALYNPVTLSDPQAGGAMTWVPVYHHADVLDHGGLAAWARQIRRTEAGDTLLAIHFDADGDTWENFAAELDALQPMVDAGEVEFTLLQDYVDTHDPVTTVELVGDQADGTGDGFQSWAEKDINHRLAARIFAARTAHDQALFFGADPADLEFALEERLLALSTTHFGLAAPYLHDTRVQTAWNLADHAYELADDVLQSVLPEVPHGELRVTNTRDTSGPVLVDHTVFLDDYDFASAEQFAIYFGEQELPVDVQVTPVLSDQDVRFRFVTHLDPGETRTFTWTGHDTAGRPAGGLTLDDAPSPAEVEPPESQCNDLRLVMAPQSADTTLLADGLAARLEQTWPIAVCEGNVLGTIGRERWDGLPGTIVDVDVLIPEVASPEDAESIALTPVRCPGLADSISWWSFSGDIRTREVRSGSDAWNGFAADGGVIMHCADGSHLGVAHRMSERSSLAFAPFRERRGQAMLAPLGTLWGDGPYHDPRRTGGSGLGEVVTTLVGSQYRPAAPDWIGQRVSYTLLVGEKLNPGTMDLFAHPPLVQFGYEL